MLYFRGGLDMKQSGAFPGVKPCPLTEGWCLEDRFLLKMRLQTSKRVRERGVGWFCHPARRQGKATTVTPTLPLKSCSDLVEFEPASQDDGHKQHKSRRMKGQIARQSIGRKVERGFSANSLPAK